MLRGWWDQGNYINLWFKEIGRHFCTYTVSSNNKHTFCYFIGFDWLRLAYAVALACSVYFWRAQPINIGWVRYPVHHYTNISSLSINLLPCTYQRPLFSIHCKLYRFNISYCCSCRSLNCVVIPTTNKIVSYQHNIWCFFEQIGVL